jgi:hypothetical protein
MVDDVFEMDQAPGVYYGAILSTLFGACILFMFFCAFWVASDFDYVPIVTPFGDWVVEALSRSQI